MRLYCFLGLRMDSQQSLMGLGWGLAGWLAELMAFGLFYVSTE